MSLRVAVLGFGVLLLGGAAVAAALGAGAAVLGPAVLGFMIVLGTVFEGRYRASRADGLGPGWERTAERFREPDGAVVEVWFNRATGERRYVRK